MKAPFNTIPLAQVDGISRIPFMYFCGVRIHSLTLQQATDQLQKWLCEDRTTTRQVCFSNVYTLMTAQSNDHFRKVTNEADLVLADGTPLVWSSHFLGCPLPQRVAGPDLMEHFCHVGNEKRYRFYLLGSTVKVLQTLENIIHERWPNLCVAGSFAPPMSETFSDKEDSETVYRINESKPDVLWVGLSSPKQDLWIYQNLSRLKVPVCIGVGAAFNFLSGDIKRAPVWMRRNGLEWLWRFTQEPFRLWKRYLLHNCAFAGLAAKEILKERRSKSDMPSTSR